LRLADALVLAVLEHAQELRLQLERQLADLVEEERALAGVLEVSRLRLRRSGEGALRASEKRGLVERGRDRGAVEREIGQGRACAEVVQREGDPFLGAPGLAFDERRKCGRGIQIDLAAKPGERRALADDGAFILGRTRAVERRGLEGAREQFAQDT